MHFPAVVAIEPSRRLRAALVFLHLLAVLALWSSISGVGVAAAGAGSLGLLLSLVVAWRGQRPLRLHLGGDGGLAVEAGDGGEASPAEPLPGALVLSWLVVVRLQVAGERRARALVVLPDCLAADDFRRLRIWLRWLARFRVSAAAA